jgi:hypothetical protein
MPSTMPNKFRDAIDVLQKGRDALVESIADEILDSGEDLVEGSYQFNELLETQGTRLHFLWASSSNPRRRWRNPSRRLPLFAPRRGSDRAQSPRGCNRRCRPKAPQRISESLTGATSRSPSVAGNLASEKGVQLLRIAKVELERLPLTSGFVEHCRVHDPVGMIGRVTPDQKVVFVCKALPVPLADPADRFP